MKNIVLCRRNHCKSFENYAKHNRKQMEINRKSKVQASLFIRGRYVPVFWTANTEFADKKAHFDKKFGLLDLFYIRE
jgi:hypothetical protein